jgi:oligopeptide transport system substrate-binding protein
MRRLLIVLTVAVAVTVAAVLLATQSQGPRADLVWTAGPEVATLDPALMTSLQDGRVAAALFEGLTVLDPHTLKARPGIAESWTVSEDGLTYTFTLRPAARWSDGQPVTADDFVYAWRRALDPATGAEYAYMLYPIRGARNYYDVVQKIPPPESEELKSKDAKGVNALIAIKLRNQARREAIDKAWLQVGIRAENPHHLVVTLERPCAYFLDLTAFSTYLPVRKDMIAKYGDLWTRPPNLVSSGAYRLVKWDFRNRMVWEKNPFYWDADHVSLNRIEVRTFDDINTAHKAYETGAVDLTTVVPAMAMEPLLKAKRDGTRKDVLYAANLGTYYYRLNCRSGPMADTRVRRALAMAIDRREIIRLAARGGQLPAMTLVPPGLPGYESPLGIEENVEKAKRLLAEAGYPGGQGLPELSVLVNKGAGHVPIAEMVQQQWADRLGVKVRIEQVEWKVFLDMMKEGKYQAARAGWYGDYVDPNTFLDLFVTGGGNNQTGWSNKQYDALIERAAAETDPEARKNTFAKAETILMDEMPIIPLYFYTTMTLARPGLEGVEPNLMNRIDFAQLKWAGGKK